jgi:hypothetical protein
MQAQSKGDRIEYRSVSKLASNSDTIFRQKIDRV